jgi:hypothetical protein
MGLLTVWPTIIAQAGPQQFPMPDVRQLSCGGNFATCLGYARYDNFVLHRINRMEYMASSKKWF